MTCVVFKFSSICFLYANYESIQTPEQHAFGTSLLTAAKYSVGRKQHYEAGHIKKKKNFEGKIPDHHETRPAERPGATKLPKVDTSDPHTHERKHQCILLFDCIYLCYRLFTFLVVYSNFYVFFYCTLSFILVTRQFVY